MRLKCKVSQESVTKSYFPLIQLTRRVYMYVHICVYYRREVWWYQAEISLSVSG